jgi:SOS response regulatory protein OraA/RecX
MRIVTALHPERRDRVRVDLDGELWRTLPATAVVSAGLRVGGALDRERARELGRSLRRFEALDAAGKALSHRDRSTAELEARLEQRGVRPSDRAAAVETMARLGYVDDVRMATDRARNMASRGFGDEAIRFDLEGRGIDTELIAAAIEHLVPEAERARAIVARSDSDIKAARNLAAKGFSPETVEAAVVIWPD